MTDPVVQKQITFSDGSKFYVKPEWVTKYPKLNEDIIYRSSKMFGKYILPVLAGQSLKTKDTDEEIELTELLNEVFYYGIELTSSQTMDLAVCSGFVRLVNRIREYIIRKDVAFFNRKYKARVAQFTSTWNAYVVLLSQKYGDDKLKDLTYDLFYELIKSDEYYSIIETNIQFKNIPYEWVSWYLEVVIKKNFDKFVQVKVDLSVSLGSGGITSFIQDASSVIKQLISSFKGTSIPKSFLLAKLSTNEKMSNLNRKVAIKATIYPKVN